MGIQPNLTHRKEKKKGNKLLAKKKGAKINS